MSQAIGGYHAEALSHKFRIMVLLRYYLPAHLAEGQVRIAGSMVECYLMLDVEFYAYTNDTNLEFCEVLKGIHQNSWQERSRARVFYASARNRTPWAISCSVRQVLTPGALGLKRGSDTVLRWLRPLGQREAI